jgi:nicotinamidase-related amidase
MPESALVLVDFIPRVLQHVSDQEAALLERVGTAAAAARRSAVPVIYVRHAYRPGAPELSRRNRMYPAISAASGYELDAPATQIHPAVAPQRDDIVVVKKRVSAFAGSDLDVVLRSLDATHLVLGGLITSGSVLSTVRQGADLDFNLTVLADGCADPDPGIHQFLLDRILPRSADVLTVEAWCGAVRQ